MTDLWTFSPNWSQGFNETLEYRTEIMLSRSGAEQRRALRTTPRRTVEFSSLLTGDDFRRFRRLMLSSQNQTILMPDFVAFVRTTATASGVLLSVSTVPHWLKVGARIVVASAGVFESRTVLAVVGTTLTLSAALSAIPAGAHVYRGAEGMLEAQIPVALATDATASVSVRFNETPARDTPRILSAPAVTLGGFEIVQLTPNWGDTVSVEHFYPSETVDFGRGRTATFRPIGFGSTTRQGTFVAATVAEIDSIKQLFERNKGRRGEFYMSSGQVDLLLKTTLPAGSTLMRVVGADIWETFATDTVHKVVCIRLNSGTRYYRTVAGMNVVMDGQGSDTVVQLSTPLPVTVGLQDVHSISWVPRTRFGSDTLIIEWLTDGVARTSVAFTSLEHKTGV